jgi:hypothetical protein
MRFKKLLISCLIMGMISVPSLMGTQNLKAQISGSDVSDILESIVKLFCPETPQNRCKQNVCQTGSCISFRKACTDDKICQKVAPAPEAAGVEEVLCD